MHVQSSYPLHYPQLTLDAVWRLRPGTVPTNMVCSAGPVLAAMARTCSGAAHCISCCGHSHRPAAPKAAALIPASCLRATPARPAAPVSTHAVHVQAPTRACVAGAAHPTVQLRQPQPPFLSSQVDPHPAGQAMQQQQHQPALKAEAGAASLLAAAGHADTAQSLHAGSLHKRHSTGARTGPEGKVAQQVQRPPRCDQPHPCMADTLMLRLVGESGSPRSLPSGVAWTSRLSGVRARPWAQPDAVSWQHPCQTWLDASSVASAIQFQVLRSSCSGAVHLT